MIATTTLAREPSVINERLDGPLEACARQSGRDRQRPETCGACAVVVADSVRDDNQGEPVPRRKRRLRPQNIEHRDDGTTSWPHCRTARATSSTSSPAATTWSTVDDCIASHGSPGRGSVKRRATATAARATATHMRATHTRTRRRYPSTVCGPCALIGVVLSDISIAFPPRPSPGRRVSCGRRVLGCGVASPRAEPLIEVAPRIEDSSAGADVGRAVTIDPLVGQSLRPHVDECCRLSRTQVCIVCVCRRHRGPPRFTMGM